MRTLPERYATILSFSKIALLALLLAGACLLTGCPVTQSQDTPVDYQSVEEPVTGSEYYLYVPSTYDRRTPTPLVVTLHGTNPWDTARMQIREWRALAESKNFIVVAPELKLNSTQGISPFIRTSDRLEALREDEQKILAILRQLKAKYNIDPKKVLLTGFSAGGYPMYYVGLRHPEEFSMLVARACNMDEDLFNHIGLTDKTRRVPVAVFFGKDDLKVIQEESWMAFRWLRRHGWSSENSMIKQSRGGHLRRPETTYSLWKNFD